MLLRFHVPAAAAGLLLLAACSGEARPRAEAVAPSPAAGAAPGTARPAVPPQAADGAWAPTALEHEALPRLLRLSDGLYSGAQPVGEESFAALRELGVRTAVCVDGAQPDVETAAAHGIAYLHIPIGYDAISEEARGAIWRAMQEAEGPFYFHCHHGKHRGPAAAAVALRASTGCGAERAAAVLASAGTSPDYPGLWHDVRTWTPPEPGAALPELVARAEVTDFAAGMAAMDRSWDRMKLVRKAGWATPAAHPDLDPAQEARILEQLMADCAERLPAEHAQDRRLQRWMLQAAQRARALRTAMEGGDAETAEGHWRDLRSSCQDCHDAYRND